MKIVEKYIKRIYIALFSFIFITVFTGCSLIDPVTSLSMNLTVEKDIYLGEASYFNFLDFNTQDFNADDITFIVSDPKTVSVKVVEKLYKSLKFEVFPLAEGTAYIYAQTSDGELKTEEIKVNVIDKKRIEELAKKEAEKAEAEAKIKAEAEAKQKAEETAIAQAELRATAEAEIAKAEAKVKAEAKQKAEEAAITQAELRATAEAEQVKAEKKKQDIKNETQIAVVEKPKPTLTLNEYNVNLEKGEKFILIPTVMNLDDKTVKYSINGKDVITLYTDGSMVALSGGQTVITVTASNGLSKTCTVNVKSDIKTINYEWDYPLGLMTWEFSLNIPQEAYDIYKSIDRNEIWDYSFYASETSDDEYLQKLAQVFVNTSEDNGYNDADTIYLIISFVQHLNYLSDLATTGYDEYPKFPLETLYDKGGDCEDTSILLASLLKELGYGAVLIAFDDHMGVGIKGADDLPGYSLTDDSGIKYYYIEATSPGWLIGDVPEEYIGKKARLMHIDYYFDIE